MPWETTDQYIRSGHRSPDEFKPESLRTINLNAIWSVMDNITEKVGRALGESETNKILDLYAAVANADLAGNSTVDLSLSLGDLVRVDWFDASIGKSLTSGLGSIDVPVQSWGIYLGVLGEKNKHIILAQNSFRYADGIYDIDYTAVPFAWTANITAIIKAYILQEEATQLLNSFLIGGKQASKRGKKQQKVRNHERLD